jgi:TRAP-type C4-dicarboxylate transport system substrate-binding protein
VLAMNPEKYASLPDDLRQIIDNNSGRELSRHAGYLWDTNVVETGHKLAQSRGNEIYVLPAEEQAKWVEIGRTLDKNWIKDVERRGNKNGAALLQELRERIDAYSAQLSR